MNSNIKKHEEETGEIVTPEQYSEFSGIALEVRSSNLNPASVEEPQSEILARDFLLDEVGMYQGDDIAIFSREVVTDNGTKSPAKIHSYPNRYYWRTSYWSG